MLQSAWWFASRSTLFLAVVFILPALATLAWWWLQERPASWSAANWGSAHVLPLADADAEPAVYLMAARTGGLKGAFAVHSWLVIKEAGAARYERYDKVGWGMPIRHNAYAPDGRWYSNMPVVVHAVRGAEAEQLIPRFREAIASYPYAGRGDYRIWPGPNSNSFVAHLLREVPEFGGQMPPNATGRDFAPGLVAVDWSADGRDLHVTLGGIIGFSLGVASGIEMHFAGLVAGVDLQKPALKIPGYGLVPLWPSEQAPAGIEQAAGKSPAES